MALAGTTAQVVPCKGNAITNSKNEQERTHGSFLWVRVFMRSKKEHSMKLNRSGEGYLKAIMALKQKKDKVRSSDIAKYMNVTKPSVSNAVRSLKEGGFLMMDENKNILFTERGQEAAKQVYERNHVIKEMLVFIGVEPEIAGQDACRIEHDISSQSFEIVKAL